MWVRGLASCLLELCRGSLHSVAAVIAAVADVVGCAWRSRWGRSEPGAMVRMAARRQQAGGSGAGPCC